MVAGDGEPPAEDLHLRSNRHKLLSAVYYYLEVVTFEQGQRVFPNR